ncbi:MAG: rRNA maturation RNAse YbeY [Kiritimatiellia bacterium]|jgi:ssRNA-specific RNase YbeY (16S rRNA maturation enzyme)
MTLTIEARPRSPALDLAAVRRLAETLADWAAESAARDGRKPMWTRRPRRVSASAARDGRKPDFGDVALCFVGPAAIARIHRDALGLPGETDVVTLAYAATPTTPAAAEIFVNAALARRRGADRADLDLTAPERRLVWSPDHELALYIAHGFDHLAGADDATPDGFAAMRQRELDWIRRAEDLGLVAGLFKKPGDRHV